jgi:hypothetical protein
MAQNRTSVSPVYGIIAIVFLAAMLWLAVSAVKGIFIILSWAAMPLFIVALIFNYRVVTDYFQWIWNMLKRDTLRGLLYTGLSVVGYPFVCAYLAFKAFATNRWGKQTGKEEQKGEYLKYEEVESEDFLELPELEEMKQKSDKKGDDNSYDELFL